MVTMAMPAVAPAFVRLWLRRGRSMKEEPADVFGPVSRWQQSEQIINKKIPGKLEILEFGNQAVTWLPDNHPECW